MELVLVGNLLHGVGSSGKAKLKISYRTPPKRMYSVQSEGMWVLYLCAQLAVLYTYNCSSLILRYYRLGQNQHIINKYADCRTLSV